MDSKLYLLWGHNPEHSDFPLHLAIEENLARGAQLVVIDPKRISLAEKAEMYLPIRPGTDAALALALMHVIINENLHDEDFVRKWTYGFERLIPHVQPYTPEWAEKVTWIPAQDIQRLARLYADAESASIHQGVNTQDQTASGTQTSRAFAILQSITGNINNRGGWVFSPRLRLTDVGIGTDRMPIGADEYPVFYEIWGRKSPYGQVVCFPESVPGVIKALIVTGGNPVVSMPDSNAFREALGRLDLLVVLDLFMTETAELAHYVLPACTHFEKNGLAYNYNVCHGFPYIMLRKQVIEPLHEGWSEFRFWTELGRKMGFTEDFSWQTDEELVRIEMSSTGLSYEELRDKHPAGAYYMEKQYGMESFRGFPTPSGKIEIYSDALEKAGHDPLPTYTEPHQSPVSDPDLAKAYPLILTTGARDLYFTHSQHRNIDQLKERSPDPIAEVNTRTAQEYGIRDGDLIIVRTPKGEIKVKARVTGDMVRGVVSVPHGWPGDANTNLLTDVCCREAIMGYPQMKSLLCSIRKADQ